ncbi:ABC transporter permease [Scopulibacillus cellulosilyticus]|uniref:ABC transporter permease n=1 Tax=Scopulibacillus cellulosilyticus TaxID=2665665 RepID=A0ABW2Q752_9BACL
MIQFLRLVKNENMKLYKRKMLWVMVLVLAAIVALSLVITLKTADKHPKDWKGHLKTEIISKEAELASKKTPKELKPEIKQEIKMDQYRINRNIPPMYDDTAVGFVQSTLGYSGLITLFIIIIASSIVSQEYSWGTIKLVLMRPLKRWKVLLSKYVSVIFNAFVIFLLLMVVSFIVGAIVFGFDDTSSRYVFAERGHIKDVSIFVHFLQYFGSKFVGLIMIAAFAFMLSTIFKNNALAIALSIFIQFAGSIISSLLSVFDKNYAKFIFFNNTDLYQYVEGSPAKGMSLDFSIVILIVYFIIFMGIAIVIFEKRDVTS